MSFLLVGAGGVVGALLRYQLSRWVSGRWFVSFPIATLVINITGAFLLGLFTRSLSLWLPEYHNALMLILGVGLCGAYTTFSTFSYELIILMREHRYTAAAVYLTATFLLGLAAAGVGLYGIPK